jgi:hypothetical protein
MGREETLGIVGILADITCVMHASQSVTQFSAVQRSTIRRSSVNLDTGQCGTV